MPPKSARAPAGRKKSLSDELSHEDMDSLRRALEGGASLERPLLLRLAGADKACPGFQTPECKARRAGDHDVVMST